MIRCNRIAMLLGLLLVGLLSAGPLPVQALDAFPELEVFKQDPRWEIWGKGEINNADKEDGTLQSRKYSRHGDVGIFFAESLGGVMGGARQEWTGIRVEDNTRAYHAIKHEKLAVTGWRFSADGSIYLAVSPFTFVSDTRWQADFQRKDSGSRITFDSRRVSDFSFDPGGIAEVGPIVYGKLDGKERTSLAMQVPGSVSIVEEYETAFVAQVAGLRWPVKSESNRWYVEAVGRRIKRPAMPGTVYRLLGTPDYLFQFEFGETDDSRKPRWSIRLVTKQDRRIIEPIYYDERNKHSFTWTWTVLRGITVGITLESEEIDQHFALGTVRLTENFRFETAGLTLTLR